MKTRKAAIPLELHECLKCHVAIHECMFFLRSGPGLRTPFASFNTRGFKLDAPAVRRYTDGMALNIREFSMSDYDAAYALWKRTEGIGLSQADKAPNVARFLARNPGLSFVAEEKGRIVGAVMCGNDGRRGFLHHLAVEKARRKTGIGKSLVERCLSALAAAGLRKCHIFVIADNIEGQRFWRKIGWEERTTLKVMSRDV